MNSSKNILESLERSIGYCNSFFSPGYGSKIKRLFKSPIKILARKLEALIFKQRYPLLVKGKTFFGYPLYVYGCTYEKDLWFCGFPNSSQDIRLTKFIIKHLKTGDTFFDIGAHHGFYSLLAHKLMGHTGTIHAFEPSPFHFGVLLKNTNYPSIFLNKIALSSKSGSLVFYEINKGSGSTTTDKFLKGSSHYNYCREEEFKKIEVPSTTLDDYCQSRNIYPSFLKIDIEGSEYDALLGAKEVIPKYKPLIAMEVWRSPNDYSNHLKAIVFLEERGYKSYRINDQGDLEQISEIVPNRDIARGADNFVFKFEQ